MRDKKTKLAPLTFCNAGLNKWHAYGDASHLGEIANGDKLKVIAKCPVKTPI